MIGRNQDSDSIYTKDSKAGDLELGSVLIKSASKSRLEVERQFKSSFEEEPYDAYRQDGSVLMQLVDIRPKEAAQLRQIPKTEGCCSCFGFGRSKPVPQGSFLVRPSQTNSVLTSPHGYGASTGHGMGERHLLDSDEINRSTLKSSMRSAQKSQNKF